MSGTLGSYSAPSGGGGGGSLPAPKVQLYKPVVLPDIFVADRGPSNGGTMQVNATRRVKITVPGIPAFILDDLAAYQPQVELMRFTRLNSRDNVLNHNGNKTSGYVHPAHGLGASGNGSFTHGGIHGGVHPDIMAIRPTEWLIANGNDAIDVTQGMLGFMCRIDLEYRDSASNIQLMSVVTPSTAINRPARAAGKRFPYSRQFMPGYFEFRLSVIDPSDSRGKRVHGPVSSRVACTNNIFPFLPAGVDVNGKAQADIDPRFDHRVMNFWIGAASRLPAQ